MTSLTPPLRLMRRLQHSAGFERRRAICDESHRPGATSPSPGATRCMNQYNAIADMTAESGIATLGRYHSCFRHHPSRQ